MWDSADGIGWWILWGGLLLVLFCCTVVGLAVWAVGFATGRRADQPTDAGSANRSPLDVAKGRYASGDIDRDEFERIRQDLQSS